MKNKKKILTYYLFPILLVLIQMRHINWGLDLWDTGYNYANFTYTGLEHMDSMWFFATYLSNQIGHLLTFLPGGHTLLGLNIYTGLIVSAFSITAYFFFINKIKMSPVIAFLGEALTLCLCLAPSALLYHYLTYIFLGISVMLLFYGLTENKKWCFVIAGIILGGNIFVRFSNLPQMALIVAVWAYGIICRKKLIQVIKETGLCLLGYLGSVGIILSCISIKYGFTMYPEAIKRLFAMTDSATDYKATSMFADIIKAYTENFYWVIRILFFVVIGILLCSVIPKKYNKVKHVFCAGLIAICGGWLYYKKFCTFAFSDYISILRPSILFLMITIVITVIQIFSRKKAQEDKLLAGLVLLVILLTPIGSNNSLYPIINNLFLVVPFTLYSLYGFARENCKWKISITKKREVTLDFRIIKYLVGLMSLIFVIQTIGFGLFFVFTEAHGVREVNTKIVKNERLAGIITNKERATQIDEISAFTKEQGLTGREVILYGNIPSLSFYLDMPAAFNTWCDLRSFQPAYMEECMKELTDTIRQSDKDLPVIILSRDVIRDVSNDASNDLSNDTSNDVSHDVSSDFSSDLTNNGDIIICTDDDKLHIIVTFMNQFGYKLTFENNLFALYQAESRNND